MKRKILLFIFTLILVLTGITNTNAYDKYDGDYTLEYLLKNYNVVTLGTKDRYDYSVVGERTQLKGSVTNIFDIGGPVLIRGNYTGNTGYENEYAQKTNCIPSYIKGNIGTSIKAGSIESAEVSNIYVGSSNKVTNNNGYYTVNNDTYKYKYPVKVSDDYVDFDKLYASIVNQQELLSQKTTTKLGETITVNSYYLYGVDSKNTAGIISISSPGYYEINDITNVKQINISNYRKDGIYVFTIKGDEIYSFPVLGVNVNIDDDSVYSGREGEEEYSGNIIWNIPEARYIYTNYSTVGHIVAPQADIELTESHYPGSIIANSISANNHSHTAIQFYPLTNNSLSLEGMNTVVSEDKEINDDLYDSNYSIDELLKNYSIVTLGQKSYSSDSKLKNLTDRNGTAKIYHIGGQFLINGNLGVSTMPYLAQQSGDYDGIKLDLRTNNLELSSYVAGNLNDNMWDSYWLTNPDTGYYQDRTTINDGVAFFRQLVTPNIYFGTSNNISYKDNSVYANSIYVRMLSGTVIPPYKIQNGNNSFVTVHSAYNSDNYIDFKTLYDAIVEQQKTIDSGNVVNPDQHQIANIKIGENYTIENVNDLRHTKFTNYNENKDKLTIITITDSGEITLPVVGYGNEGNDYVTKIFTNDYMGGYTYSSDGQKMVHSDNNYFGNIVWNIPNATHIKLAEEAPFVGHIIAPNADVETPELHFAGAMIVNSLYTEGHTEAHFYPLTVGSVGTGIKKETKTVGGEVEKITISGTKTWDDNDNQDGVRPESVTINLLANGEKIDSQVITAKENWKYEFNVPRVDENGVKINYTITEDAIEHYSTKIESFSNDTCPSGCKVSIDGYNITNSYTPKKTSLTVNKVWKDENNADKLRPDSVEVEVYANGKRIDSAILNEENNWTYIFNEIDMYQNGEKIAYTVKETTKLKGYTTKISGDQETGYTITNTHVVKKENPTTGDNIKKFLMISGVSALLLVVCLVIFKKYRRKRA